MVAQSLCHTTFGPWSAADMKNSSGRVVNYINAFFCLEPLAPPDCRGNGVSRDRFRSANSVLIVIRTSRAIACLFLANLTPADLDNRSISYLTLIC